VATIGGVPSERGNRGRGLPRALPWAGMRCPFGTRGIWRSYRTSCRDGKIPRALRWAGMRCPFGTGGIRDSYRHLLRGVRHSQGVALGWYAGSFWDKPSPQRGDCIPAQGATPGTDAMKPMRSEGTPHRSGGGGCDDERRRSFRTRGSGAWPTQGRCPGLVCGVPLGHGESGIHSASLGLRS
jgi:hypothetical protein